MQTGRARRTTVAVRPEAELRARPRLFATLEDAFAVNFTAAGDGEAKAVIALGGDPVEEERPLLRIGATPKEGAAPRAVRFGDHDPADRRIAGISVLDPLDGPALESTGGEVRPLATSGSRAVWTVTRGSFATWKVASSLPELESPRTLRDLLDQRPLAMIALVEFLRRLPTLRAYRPPPLRAAILFDDPNLRWRTYGFIDYGELLAHADAHDYHASMAMIPLDSGRQHGDTVELFRRRPDRLSLAFHGNDHVTRELMRVRSDEQAVSILAQALRRASRFESRYNLRLDRVMTAPHGMCAATVARALGPLGFDALCAIHPLPWSEQPPANRPLAGWGPAEFAAGCAVIPRLPLTVGAGEIALRAYLDQPLVLYGHHGDLADGLDLLAEQAAVVNRLGTVRWSGLGEIAATNLTTSLREGTLRLRPYSHRLRVSVPDEADSLVVESPAEVDQNFVGCSLDAQNTLRGSFASPSGDNAQRSGVFPFDTPVRIAPGGVELWLAPGTPINPTAVASPRPHPWPVVRRAATEARDRLRPLVRSAAG